MVNKTPCLDAGLFQVDLLPVFAQRFRFLVLFAS